MSQITPFRFSVLSDLHRRDDPGEWFQLALGFLTTSPFYSPGEFIVSTGDLAYSNDSTAFDFRERIDETLGASYRWIPVVGNHDITDVGRDGDATAVSMDWIEAEFYGQGGGVTRESISDFATGGPPGVTKTQYYWIQNGILFMVLNPYWTGENTATAARDWIVDDSDVGGTIVDATLEWVTDVFSQYRFYPKIVFAHPNAFTFSSRHGLTNLAKDNLPNRNKLWRLFNSNNVIAYVHGHTHILRFDFVDDSYDNSGLIAGDVWTYGRMKTAHICPGAIHPYAISEQGWSSFIVADVTEASITFSGYGRIPSGYGLAKQIVLPIPQLDEYGTSNRGGKWFYTQRKFGTTWFNTADNAKGWTVDFNLTVDEVQNSMLAMQEDEKPAGTGIYVNDGTRQEIVRFMPQHVIFDNAQQSVVFDTTFEHNYRLTGKGDQLKLYAKSSSAPHYSEIADISFKTKATNNGNALEPSVFEDASGTIHAVWWDDGDGGGTIYYSKFANSEYAEWTEPQEVVSVDYGVRSPTLVVTQAQEIYVIYESKQTEGSVIGLVYHDGIGWSEPYYTGIGTGRCEHPRAVFDSVSNVCVVWEDSRYVHPDIFADVFDVNELAWRGEIKVSSGTYGCFRPAVSSYLDDIFVSWTQKEVGNTSQTQDYSVIKIAKFNSNVLTVTSPQTVSSDTQNADHSSVLANVSGTVFVAWHDDSEGSYKIYSSILNPGLDLLSNSITVVDAFGGARYPVLSEHLTTGDVYIVWQDFKDILHDKFVRPLDLSDPYYDSPTQEREPLQSSLYAAVYRDGNFLSSGVGSFDVAFSFGDSRNAYNPAVPPFFSGSLPVLYQSHLSDEYTYMDNSKFMFHVKCATYDLSRTSAVYAVPVSGDYSLNKNYFTKEIRFGDFSNIFNAHYVFKNVRMYTTAAVEPYSITEIDANTFGLDSLSGSDAIINNYGDVWIVGTCGVFYYIDRQNRIARVGPDEEIPGLISVGPTSSSAEKTAEISALRKFKAIAFDAHHNMYVGGDEGIRYSLDPKDGFQAFPVSLTDVRALIFDKDNKLFVGTTTGLYVYGVSEEGGTVTATDISSTFENLPSSCVTSFGLDDNNCVWAGTWDGLYRLYNYKVLRFSTTDGLSSNRINDIAIRNTAIRYLATPNGINKMVGLAVEKNIQSDDTIWNNNVKSLLWKAPNILLAGTMNRLNQIEVDDVDETYTTVMSIPGSTSGTDFNDLQTFYILADTTISDDDIIEVYVNGNKISHGYVLGRDETTTGSPRILRFLTPLQHDDIVEVTVRGDLKLLGTFAQTEQEKATIGDKVIRIKDFAATQSATETKLYVATCGGENEIKVNDSTSLIPYDRVHLDTTPPSFVDGAVGLKIIEQLDRNIVKVSITGATDASDTDSGSGIDRMIISNYRNFTTDGSTAQSSVPFATTSSHNLGETLENVVQELAFSSGTGSSISYFSDVNELYAATSLPAKVYKYDWVDAEWDLLYSYGDDQYIDFIEKHNNKLFIGVGHPTNNAVVYVYGYVSSGALVAQASLAISESRAYSAHELDGKLYISSGIGAGNEYVEGSGAGGAIYVYNDGTTLNVAPSLTKVIGDLDDNIYDLTHSEGSSQLLAVSGGSGYIYEVDVENVAAYIVHNDSEAIVSVGAATYGGSKYVFSGGASSGVIRRSLASNNSFDASFRTVASTVNVIKTFSIGSSGATASPTVFAAVGRVLYYFSSSGTWMWKYSHSEEIQDVEYNSSMGTFYVISASGITRIDPTSQTKYIYLKLIDRAGNESVLNISVDASGNPDASSSPFVDSITIAELSDFVNENKLLQLDEYGDITYTLRSNSKFYSGDKVSEERGEYVSEIFDGTNDLVKWSTLSWEATELHGTSVLMYVRTSSSRTGILTASWIGAFTTSQASGVDLSAYSGQYIQFKVVLTSSTKGITPSFHSATIRAITTESIHFFTTNFVLPARVKAGIITSQKIVPVAADVVFGINTTNSIDWTEYEEVDENRLFNISQVGTNFRVGIKLISPNRSLVTPTSFDEYGPYNSNLYVNTVDLDFTNNSGLSHDYHFRITLYSDVALTNEVYSAYSGDSSEGFNVGGEAIPDDGVTVSDGETVNLLFTVPGSANIQCNTYYFAKVEYNYGSGYVTISNDHSFVSSCTSNFIDSISFTFINDEAIANYYHFRIKFYKDPERLDEYKTVFSGNDRSGWFIDDVQIPEDGALITSGQTVGVVYRPTATDYTSNKVYYLTIEAHDGTDYVFASNSYTFQMRDVQSTEYCGGYVDVPIVKNFGIMFELDENEFVTLNI